MGPQRHRSSRSASTSGTRSSPSPAACVIGLPIGLAIGHTGRGRFVASNVAGLWRAIPTVGVVALLFRWRPLTLWPVLVALLILAVPPIVLNTVAGHRRRARRRPRRRPRAWASPAWQALWQVEVPNALPLILAGIRSAANQVIATATIAGFVGLGALGVFIFSGAPDAASTTRWPGRRSP